jgi:hypothetical protein
MRLERFATLAEGDLFRISINIGTFARVLAEYSITERLCMSPQRSQQISQIKHRK